MSNLSRLTWRCHRGMKELDTLLQLYLQSDYPQLSTELQQVFEQFLDEPDPEIYAWITGHTELPNNRYRFLIDRLRTINTPAP